MKNRLTQLQEIRDNDRPQNIFPKYQEKREICYLQELWNLGIHLHEIRGNKWTQCDYYEPSINKRLIKVYDMIDGKLTFTKIGVYEIKNNHGK